MTDTEILEYVERLVKNASETTRALASIDRAYLEGRQNADYKALTDLWVNAAPGWVVMLTLLNTAICVVTLLVVWLS